MMNDQEIMHEFEAAEAILRGHFILSSGLHSDTYLQCARVLMNPGRAGKFMWGIGQPRDGGACRVSRLTSSSRPPWAASLSAMKWAVSWA